MTVLSGVPVIKTVADCANFDLTVKPYLEALSSLPQHLTTSYFKTLSTDSIVHLYLGTNPLVSAFILSLVLGVVFFVVSEVNRNYSQVDRLWSILPATYVLHFNIWARQHGVANSKLDLLLLTTSVWSTRLTFNYWRRGGYSIGSEDYRWNIIKAQIGGVGMFVLNITFISFVQSVLLLLIASPGYIQLLVSRIDPGLQVPDIIFASIILSLVLIEFTADQQQWGKLE
jgi:steroid 5-alpha reductase family enzyme